MAEPSRTLPMPRILGVVAAMIGLFIGSHGQAQAQQNAPSAQPTPCIGYSYNIRQARMVIGGIQTVAEVLPGTPAEAGGLRPGDILVSVAGVPTNSGGPSATLVPGDTIPFVVNRDGHNVTLTMVVGQRQTDPSGDSVCRPVAKEPAGR
jgi:S1-C subfamily serine protease